MRSQSGSALQGATLRVGAFTERSSCVHGGEMGHPYCCLHPGPSGKTSLPLPWRNAGDLFHVRFRAGGRSSATPEPRRRFIRHPRSRRVGRPRVHREARQWARAPSIPHSVQTPSSIRLRLDRLLLRCRDRRRLRQLPLLIQDRRPHRRFRIHPDRLDHLRRGPSRRRATSVTSGAAHLALVEWGGGRGPSRKFPQPFPIPGTHRGRHRPGSWCYPSRLQVEQMMMRRQRRRLFPKQRSKLERFSARDAAPFDRTLTLES